MELILIVEKYLSAYPLFQQEFIHRANLISRAHLYFAILLMKQNFTSEAIAGIRTMIGRLRDLPASCVQLVIPYGSNLVRLVQIY